MKNHLSSPDYLRVSVKIIKRNGLKTKCSTPFWLITKRARALRDFLTNVAFTIRQGRQEQGREVGRGGLPTRLRVQPSAEMVVNKADRADRAAQPDRDDYFVLIFL